MTCTLRILPGEGRPAAPKDGPPRRVYEALAVMWEAEVVSARRMTALAERLPDPRERARVMVLAAFCRAHASRLHARLAKRAGPVPVVDESHVSTTIHVALRDEADFARRMADRYEMLVELARQHSDLSTAWVAELNRTEEEDRARELMTLAAKHAAVKS